MMNLFAIILVVTTLAAAGVWSPPPDKSIHPKEEVILKDGRRVIVVEYEKEGLHNTKVLISPTEEENATPSAVGEKSETSVVGEAKEKLKEASSVLPNLGQGISNSYVPETEHQARGARELICDAFGRCKHRIADTFGKSKEKVSEETDKVEEGAKEVKETAKETKETVKEAAEKEKNTIAHSVGEGVKHSAKKAKDAAKVVVETPKSIVEDVAENVKEDAEIVKEHMGKSKKAVEHKAEDIKAGAHKLKKESEKELSDILHRARELAIDFASYFVGPKPMNSLLAMVQLLGFATAYGTAMWVTFISSYVLAAALPRQQFGMVQSKIYPVYFRVLMYSIAVALIGHLLRQRKRLFTSVSEMLQAYNLALSIVMVLVNLLYLEPKATKVMFERMKIEKEEGRGRDEGRRIDGILETTRVLEPLSAATTRVLEPLSAADAVVTGAANTTSTTATEAVLHSPGRQHQADTNSQVIRLSERLKQLNSYSSGLNIFTLMFLTWHLVYLGQRVQLSS